MLGSSIIIPPSHSSHTTPRANQISSLPYTSHIKADALSMAGGECSVSCQGGRESRISNGDAKPLQAQHSRAMRTQGRLPTSRQAYDLVANRPELGFGKHTCSMEHAPKTWMLRLALTGRSQCGPRQEMPNA
jgi:hypothetical protein